MGGICIQTTLSKIMSKDRPRRSTRSRLGKGSSTHRNNRGARLPILAVGSIRHAAEAAHALRHVGLEADPPPLAVIDLVDAGLRQIAGRPFQRIDEK